MAAVSSACSASAAASCSPVTDAPYSSSALVPAQYPRVSRSACTRYASRATITASVCSHLASSASHGGSSSLTSQPAAVIVASAAATASATSGVTDGSASSAA